MTAARTIRWGILATGAIAETFTRDLLADPTTRGVNDFKHTVVAAASSSSVSRAQDFLKKVKAPSEATAYGSYEEFAKNPDIDIVYIATPHSHHYQNAMLVLEAGKNVLCEKALTVNAAQAKKLYEKAKEKGLFFMEAVWTRYFPLSIYVRDIIKSGKIGPVARVSADNGFAEDPEKKYPDGKHRMVNPELAGGALLDLGIYSLTWVFQALYTVQDPATRQKPDVDAAVKLYNHPPVNGGADETTTIVLRFPRPVDQGGDAHAVAQTSIRVASDPLPGQATIPAIRIRGPKGEIQVFPPAFRPTRTRLVLADGTIEDKQWLQPGPGAGSGWYNGFSGDMNAEGEGHGMFWEADEAARCLIAGKKESATLTWEESVTIMEVMDKAREKGGLKYPAKIESTDYPVQL